MATTPASSTTATSSSTNLDVNGIVSQLMKVERQPIEKLNIKEASYQAKLTSYGVIKGAVSSFETAVSDLNSTTKFQSLKATPSDAAVFTASATSIASAGTYSMEVTSLAQAQNLIAQKQASTTVAIGAGTDTTVTFDFGTITGSIATPYDPAVGASGKYSGGATFVSNGKGIYSITINSGNNTLEGVRDAINAAGMGMTATIINDGDATAPYRLVLSSDSVGASHSAKITVSGDSAISGLLAHDPAGTQNLAETVTAKNANLKINGVVVSKDSNSVSDVIHGVTLNLLAVTTAPVKLTVARDTSTISTSVASLIKAYNELAGIFKTETAYDVTAKKGATLQGDFTVRNLQAQMRSILSSAVSGTSGALNTLSDVGVAFQKDGTLKLDQAKLDTAMKDHFADISILFSSDNGYLTTLNTLTTSVLASNGALANRTGGIGKTITDISNRRAEMENRLLSIEKRYRAQFTNLDSMLSSMNTTSNYLTQQLAKL
jgi:flagellar hook-associated protein 2